MSLNELSKALVEAQKAVNAVAKDSTNSFHRYKYASAESLIEEGRRVLNSAGLALSQVEWEFRRDNHADDGSIGRVFVNYELRHAAGAVKNWSNSSPVIPDKGRPADKAEWAALTENFGYTIRGLLQIPRQDAPDVSGRDDTQKPKNKPAQPDVTEEPAPSESVAAIAACKSQQELEALLPSFDKFTPGQKKALRPIYKARLDAVNATA